MRLEFGKYKGTELSAVPEDYINYLISQQEKSLGIYKAELERRKMVEEGAMSLVERIASAGYKALARTMHPDFGGSVDDFKALSAANEKLKLILKEVASIV